MLVDKEVKSIFVILRRFVERGKNRTSLFFFINIK